MNISLLNQLQIKTSEGERSVILLERNSGEFIARGFVTWPSLGQCLSRNGWFTDNSVGFSGCFERYRVFAFST